MVGLKAEAAKACSDTRTAWSNLRVRARDRTSAGEEEPWMWLSLLKVQTTSETAALLTFAGLPTRTAPEELDERGSLRTSRALLDLLS